jgi:hypothetical protein
MFVGVKKMKIELSLNQIKLINDALEHCLCFGVFDKAYKRKAEYLSNRMITIINDSEEQNNE